MGREKIMVAMSGGVDSSVAAYLLKSRGCHADGVTLRLYYNCDAGLAADSTCCSAADIEDARSVATRLGMDFFVYNFSDDFRRNVMDRFAAAYIRGDTPNPCIDCNRYIKFDKLYTRAKMLGYDGIATGHYARVDYDAGSGRWLLKKGMDAHKDQSYVLYCMTQEQLAHTSFPVGELSKEEVRKIAEANAFVNAGKPDSQDICFVPDGDYKSFIERTYGYKSVPGDFVDRDGRILGRHRGLIGYTIGQRRGLGVSADRPLYVLKKNLEKNQVILGDNRELFSSTLLAADVNFVALAGLNRPIRAEAKIRYSHHTAPALLIPEDEGKVRVEFDTPQRAPTPGQSVVFYDGETVLAGGIIQS